MAMERYVMTPKVSQYLNKTILVSIPTLFHDGKCRPLKLIGVEVPGLWLQADELSVRLLPDQLQTYVSAAPIVFVPFAHIAGVLIPTKAPSAAPSPPVDSVTPTPTPTPTPAPAAADTASSAPQKAQRQKKGSPPKTAPPSSSKS
jgi:hypothetical protein